MPEGARILFLGSFPPQAHRWCMPFYYPNWINDFWRIMGLIYFGDKDHFTIIGEKRFNEADIRAFCTEHRLAFYDTATEVRRLKDNASDAFLEVITPTDIPALLKRIPLCRTLVTTGQKATEVVAQAFGCPLPPVGEWITLRLEPSDPSAGKARGTEGEGAPAAGEARGTGGDGAPSAGKARGTGGEGAPAADNIRGTGRDVSVMPGSDRASFEVKFWRMPSTSRAYPMPIENKADAYRKLFTPRKKLILWDLDGTLIDTIEDLAAAVNHALELRGLPFHSVAQYRKMVGHGVRNLVTQALEASLNETPDQVGGDGRVTGGEGAPATSEARGTVGDGRVTMGDGAPAAGEARGTEGEARGTGGEGAPAAGEARGTVGDISVAAGDGQQLRAPGSRWLKEFGFSGTVPKNIFIQPQGEQLLPQEGRLPEAYIDAALADFKEYYSAHIDVHTRPYPGMQELLRELQAKGVKMAVASNKFQEGTEHLIREFFPDIQFVAILGNRPGYPLKPDPEIVREVLAKAAARSRGEDGNGDKDYAPDLIGPEDTIMVGDSPTDMRTAANGGIDAVAVSWGYRTEEELAGHPIAHSIEELRRLLCFT